MAKQVISNETLKRLHSICSVAGMDGFCRQIDDILSGESSVDGIDVVEFVNHCCVIALGIVAQQMRDAVLYHHNTKHETVQSLLKTIKYLTRYAK